MKAIKALYQGFCRIEEALCNIGFAGMVMFVFLSAIARNVGHPLAWSLDVAQLMLCWVTLIGADVAFRHGKFMGLDLLTRKFSVKIQRILELLVDVIILITLIIFIVYGFKLTVDSWKRSFQTLKLSYSFVTMALPVMSVLMSVSVVLDIVKQFKKFTASEKNEKIEFSERSMT